MRKTVAIRNLYGPLSTVQSRHVLPPPNSCLQIWQRGTTFIPAAAADTPTADRWRWWQASGTTGVVTITRDTTNQISPGMAGCQLNQSLLVTVSTADGTLAAGDSYTLYYLVAVKDCMGWLFNPFVISFWVYNTLPGIYALTVRNTNNTAVCTAEYVIDNANQWEYKEVAFPAASSLDTWNYAGDANIIFDLGSGSTFDNATTNQWVAGNTYSTANSVNFMATIGNKFYITGLDITVGNKARQLQPEAFPVELERCQYWYEKSFNYSDPPQSPAPNADWGGAYLGRQIISSASHATLCHIDFQVRKAAVPIITLWNPGATASSSHEIRAAGGLNWASSSATDIGEYGFNIAGTSPGSGPNAFYAVHWEASAG